MEKLTHIEKRLTYFTQEMSKVQTDNKVCVYMNAVGNITMTVQDDMTKEKESLLVKRVTVIATAFEDMCEKGERIARQGMELKDLSVRLGRKPDSLLNNKFMAKVSVLQEVKANYYRVIRLH